jgi:hypothetical protein
MIMHFRLYVSAFLFFSAIVIFTTADGLAQERETVLDRVVHVEEGAILEVPETPRRASRKDSS